MTEKDVNILLKGIENPEPPNDSLTNAKALWMLSGKLKQEKMTPFYFHYDKDKKCMVLHYSGSIIYVKDINCHTPTRTKWNDGHPTLVLEGECNAVTISTIKNNDVHQKCDIL